MTVFRCDAICKKDTGKALLVEIEGDEYWIPKSQIDESSEVNGEQANEGDLAITEWIAIRRGLV